METSFFYFFVFIFGLLIGSFLNALVWRLQKGESLVKRKRSHCVHCDTQIQARDLIPLVSFAFLRGKCRACRKAISWQYPLMELVTGLLFVYSAWSVLGTDPLGVLQNANDVLRVITLWFFVSVLLSLFIYDFKHSLLPDALTLPSIVIALGLNVLLGVSLWDMLLAVVIGGGFFLAQFVFSKGQWIGGGDIRLGVLMGVMLSWPTILVALFLAYVIGAVVGVALIGTKKLTMKSQIPFGTFLTCATLITLFYGERILDWYMGMLGA